MEQVRLEDWYPASLAHGSAQPIETIGMSWSDSYVWVGLGWAEVLGSCDRLGRVIYIYSTRLKFELKLKFGNMCWKYLFG